MQKNPTLCSCFKVIISVILFNFITCDCPYPKRELPNGRFVYQQLKDINETSAKELYILRFKCYAGYQRIGPRYIQCLDDEWSDVVPTCAKMQCSDPPDVDKAEFKLHSGVDKFPTIGASVTYSCKIGYELKNTSASTLHCELDPGASKAIWKGEIPFCKEKESCPDPGVSKHGFRVGSCCFSGDILQFSCNEDYELVGQKEVQCLRSGSWSSGRPLCKPLSDYCQLPPSIPHGIVSGEKEGDYFIPYDEAEVVCEPGYKHVGPTQFVMCEEEGEWEDEFGECTEIICDLPKQLVNGTIPEMLTTNLTSFPYGFEITYFCDDGFRLVGGDSWRTCSKKGWSGKTPYCEAIQCPDPGLPENGFRTGDNFEVGAKVRFKCFTGYYLLGSFERYCKPNGQWSGELSRCDTPSNYCPNPGIPVKGYKNISSYEMGDKVGFHCQPGYVQIGSEVRECLPNRTWSGTETTCLGPYDYDNSAQVRDVLRAKLAEKAEEQERETQRYREALYASWHNNSGPVGRILDINFPGRLILYFAFDVSGSVGQHNFDKSIEFAKAIVKRVGISEAGARAGALIFGSKSENMFLPLSYTTTEEVLDALDKINYTGGGTAASSALSLIRQENIPLIDGVLGKKNIKSIIFILTDGKANMGGSPEVEADLLKKAGVEIYCIGITGSIEKESLYKIASTSKDSNGEHPNVFILQNYATMSWLVQEITNGTVDYAQCGLGMENVGNEAARGRILNGKKSMEPWPWMAALYMPHDKLNPLDTELQCGGSIINNYFILTAAHCMYHREGKKRSKKDIIVKLGLTDVKNETYVQESEVSEMFIHPDYRPAGSYDYDIALLLLDKPIEYNPFVRPICLPPTELPENTPLYSSDEFGWATGWGHEGVVSAAVNERLKSSQILKELLLPIQSKQRCTQSLLDNKVATDHFTDRMFCAGDGKRGNDTCKGDSGGPLMQSQLNSEGYLFWTQVGIVSWGIGCGKENTYGYYTHVQKFRSWIDSTIEAAMAAIQ
uniref:limulus clotting factor C n=1 Tax=Hasarius adansoni TaxID=243517 RepID=A0A0E4B7Y9_9ARAC|nr:complement factor B-1 [Hasarius adansoni]